MQSNQLRTLRKQFRETKAPADRKHARANPASLIVNSSEDATTMFNTAGMQPLVPYLMGKPHPTGAKRVYNIQWCVRTVDIEEVGDSSHLTYFEMMGNRSLGDYFKKESVAWSRELLTSPSYLGLDTSKLSVTVFEGDENAPRDDETADLWRTQWLPEHRITFLDKHENRRWPAGATWPCGPDTEIFYRVGAGDPPLDSNPWNDDEQRMEIWNNVFMAYYKDDEWNYTELENKNVDTGMGFERLCMVLQNKDIPEVVLSEKSVYDTDIFQALLAPLDSKLSLEAKRIIADHGRTAFMLMDEWLSPSNEWRGYVLRRMIRRLYFQRYAAGIAKESIKSYFLIIEKELKSFYWRAFDGIVDALVTEVEQFDRTIHNGQKRLEWYIADHTDSKVLPGDEAFKLHDTYGYPIDLTSEVVQSHGWTVDMDWYEKASEAAKVLARAWSSKKFAKWTDRASVVDGMPQTEFVWYENLEAEGMKLLKDIDVDGRRVLIFDRTPMYAESWGQRGDRGVVTLDSGEDVTISDVQKYGGVFLHMVG